MNDLNRLRQLLAELPISDAELEPVSGVLNRIEEAIAPTEAILSRMQSIERMVDMRFFKQGEPCPLCHRNSQHSPTCYMRATTGWDLLAEHEATLRENDELRQALAVHLPHNGKMVLSGGTYKGLKARARTGSSGIRGS